MACWISLDKNTASKDATVRMTYDRNTTGEKRTATVEVKSPDGAIVKRYTITQKEQVLVGNDLRTKECTKDCGDGGVSASQEIRVEPDAFMAETKEEANALADEELKKKCESLTPTLTCTWTNDEITRPVQKNDCLVTEKGSFVDWTVDAGKYSSTISKEDANTKAEVEFEADGAGQENANLHGTCTTTLWYSKEMRKNFPVTKCEENFTPVPSEVEYVVPAGKYSWTDTLPPVGELTGQEAADKLAQDDLEANGPGNANLPENSTCEENEFFLGKYSNTYTRSDCAEHFHSPELFVDQTNTEVPGYPWKSYISQDDANDLAQKAIDDYGKAKVQEMDCIEDEKWIGVFSMSFTKTCADNGSGSSHVIDVTMVEGYPQSVTSYESEAVANGLAEAAVKAQGQAIADAIPSGTCTWVGDAQLQKQRDNCEEGFVGSFVMVTANMTTGYPENCTSTVSAEDAKTKAKAAVDAQAQAIANERGTCEQGTVYYGLYEMTLRKQNCGDCKRGKETKVTSDDVSGANKYPSLESQAAANLLAKNDMESDSDTPGVSKAQAWINKNGLCEDDPAQTSNPTWADTDELRCLDGKSQKKQINTNTCYTGTDQEQWVNGGDMECTWTGVASKAFTPACNSSYQGTDHKGTASGTVTITQADVTGGPFTSTVSQDDANAKALAAITAQGQAIADQRGISSGMCTWTAVYSKTYTRDDCGSCMEPSDACTNTTVTSTQVNSNAPVSSTISYEDAYNKAVNTLTVKTEGKEAGQNYVNKNCGNCVKTTAVANWQPIAGEVDVCDNCTSKRLHRDIAECSTTEGETMLRPYGSKNCDKTGTETIVSSSTRCNGCTPQVLKRYSCGGEEYVNGGSRNCDNEGGVSRYSYSCTNCTRYRTTHYGCGGTYTEAWAYNSADCDVDIYKEGCDGRASVYWYEGSCSGNKTSGNTQIDRCGCAHNFSDDCVATGYKRTCEKDSNGCYTGYGTQDYSSQSECHDCSQKEEERVYIPSLCYSDKTPNWQYISGAYQCTKVSDYSPGNAMVCSGKQQQQDKNMCSNTGGDYKWVDSSAACVKADAKSTTYTCSQLGLSGTGSVTLSIGSSDFCGKDKSTANAIRDNWISTNGSNWAKQHISCTPPPSTTGTLVINYSGNGTITSGRLRVFNSTSDQYISLSGRGTIGQATLSPGTYNLALDSNNVQAQGACGNSNTNTYTATLARSATITSGQATTISLTIACPGS